MAHTPKIGGTFDWRIILAAMFLLLPTFSKMYAGDTGQLAVASPDLSDPHYGQTIIYLVHHELIYTWGVVLNKPLADIERQGLPENLRQSKFPVYWGGPDHTEDQDVFILQLNPDSTIKLVTFAEWVKAEPDILTKIEEAYQVQKDASPYRVLVGHMEWILMQYEMKKMNGEFRVAPYNPALILHNYDHPQDLWERVLGTVPSHQKTPLLF